MWVLMFGMEKIKNNYRKEGLASNITYETFQDTKKRIWIPTSKGITMIREISNSDGEQILKLKIFLIAIINLTILQMFLKQGMAIFMYGIIMCVLFKRTLLKQIIISGNWLETISLKLNHRLMMMIILKISAL